MTFYIPSKDRLDFIKSILADSRYSLYVELDYYSAKILSILDEELVLGLDLKTTRHLPICISCLDKMYLEVTLLGNDNQFYNYPCNKDGSIAVKYDK
jgi:hypothetical protein